MEYSSHTKIKTCKYILYLSLLIKNHQFCIDFDFFTNEERKKSQMENDHFYSAYICVTKDTQVLNPQILNLSHKLL